MTLVGKPAPDFRLPSTKHLDLLNEPVSLRDFRGSDVAQRGLFIIDPEGVVRYEVVHDMEVGCNVDEALRVLAALQTKGKTAAGRKHGEPNLIPGAPSLN